MQDWQTLIKNGLQDSVKGHSFWESCLDSMVQGKTSYGLHLAVFLEPYLRYILEGKKTVESRFSGRRIAPYGNVQCDDVILLKRSGDRLWVSVRFPIDGIMSLIPNHGMRYALNLAR